MIDLGLQGKGALVSGAGYIPERAGHGRISALKLAEAGATVACVDIDKGRAEGIVSEISSNGGKAIPVIADMTDPAQVQRAVDEAAAGLGSIDVCVDIIGGATWDKAEETSLEDWNWTILNNVSQVFYLFQTAGRQMIKQGTGGSMVALASVDGINAAAMHAPYRRGESGSHLAGQDLRPGARSLRNPGQRSGTRQRGRGKRGLAGGAMGGKLCQPACTAPIPGYR